MKLATYFLLVVFFAVYNVQGNSRIFSPNPDTEQKRNIALLFKSKDQFCTGAIINAKWLLTSASCARLVNYYDMRAVINIDSTDPFTHSHLVIKAIPHPKFNPITLVNDIGLINVNIADDDGSESLKLQSVNENLVGLNCIVRGFGVTSPTQNVLPTVKIGERNVLTTNSRYCSNLGETVTNKICTFGGYACKGDQGAPLTKTGTDEIIGIASINNGSVICGDSIPPTTMFTHVYPYKSWIKTTTGISNI